MIRKLSAPLRTFFNVRFETVGSEAHAAHAQADAAVAVTNALRAEVAALSERVARLAAATETESDRLVAYLALLGRTIDELAQGGRREGDRADDGDHVAA